MVGKLLLIGVLGAGFGYVYPIWNESTHTTCQALESRFIAMAAPLSPVHPGRLLEQAVLRSAVEPLSNGRIAALEMKQRYPALPPQIGCAVRYWTSLLDPRVQRAIQSAMK